MKHLPWKKKSSTLSKDKGKTEYKLEMHVNEKQNTKDITEKTTTKNSNYGRSCIGKGNHLHAQETKGDKKSIRIQT